MAIGGGDRPSKVPFSTGASILLEGLVNPGAAPLVPPPGELDPSAAAEWGTEQAGAPRTIAAAVWSPPSDAFQRAMEQTWIAFQPIVRLSTRSTYGFEALLRSSDTLLSDPRLLVDAAERSGRLHDLARRVRTLVAAAAQSLEDGPLIFVNLRPQELLDDRLLASDDPLGPLAHRCVLELTERVALDEIPQARARIQQLRLLGYRIAIGNVGSGYADLASIADLEPDVVKLDLGLIRNLNNELVRRRLVGGLLTTCADLNLDSIAEGVETAGERDALGDLGCDLMQGYLFGRPDAGFPRPQW